MTIHHDKLAYGRLKGLNDELSEDDILKLVEQLNGDEEDEESEKNEESKESKESDEK